MSAGKGKGRGWGCPGSLRTTRYPEEVATPLVSRRTRARYLVPSTQRSHPSPGARREAAGNSSPHRTPAGALPRPGRAHPGPLSQENGPTGAEGEGGAAGAARTTDAQLRTACHRRPAGKPRGAGPIGPEAEAGWLPSTPGGAGSREGEGGAGSREGEGGAGHGASPEAEPSPPHPAAGLPGASPQPLTPAPTPGPVPVGDPPRDSVMQNGYDLQRVSVRVQQQCGFAPGPACGCGDVWECGHVWVCRGGCPATCDKGSRLWEMVKRPASWRFVWLSAE